MVICNIVNKEYIKKTKRKNTRDRIKSLEKISKKNLKKSKLKLKSPGIMNKLSSISLDIKKTSKSTPEIQPETIFNPLLETTSESSTSESTSKTNVLTPETSVSTSLSEKNVSTPETSESTSKTKLENILNPLSKTKPETSEPKPTSETKLENILNPLSKTKPETKPETSESTSKTKLENILNPLSKTKPETKPETSPVTKTETNVLTPEKTVSTSLSETIPETNVPETNVLTPETTPTMNIRDLNFKEKKMKGDGNCGYYAVLYGLNKKNKKLNGIKINYNFNEKDNKYKLEDIMEFKNSLINYLEKYKNINVELKKK